MKAYDVITGTQIVVDTRVMDICHLECLPQHVRDFRQDMLSWVEECEVYTCTGQCGNTINLKFGELPAKRNPFLEHYL